MTEPAIEDAEVVEGGELVPQGTSTLFRTNDPAQVVTRATETADALKDVLKSKGLVQDIQGKEYVRVEGWTLLGSMLGVLPVVVWTRKVEDGWEARVEAKTLDGRTVGAAEAQCSRDERMWKQRDEYALRSMAQTRATSKALRGPLGFIVHLAGYEATPAEEMPTDGPARQEPSDKQIAYVERLLKDAKVDNRDTLLAYARGELTSQFVSALIDRLKAPDEKQQTLVGFAEAAEEWASKQTDIPADTDGLEIK